MADDPNSQPERKKRRLRASTETVRERTAKQQNKQPKKTSPLSTFLYGFSWPLRMLGRGLAAIGRFLGKFKLFRIIGYILVPKYIRSSWKELRLVTWPDRRRTAQLTFAVIVFSVVFGLVVAGVDYVFGKIFKEIIIS